MLSGLFTLAVSFYIPGQGVLLPASLPSTNGTLVLGNRDKLTVSDSTASDTVQTSTSSTEPVETEEKLANNEGMGISKDVPFSFYSILRYFKDKKGKKYQDEYGSYFDDTDDTDDCTDSDDDWYDPFEDDDCNDNDRSDRYKSDEESCGSDSDEDYDPFYDYDYDSDYPYTQFDNRFKYYVGDSKRSNSKSGKTRFLKHALNKSRLREKTLIRALEGFTNSSIEPISEMVNNLGISAGDSEMLANAWYKFYKLFAPVKSKLVDKLKSFEKMTHGFSAAAVESPSKISHTKSSASRSSRKNSKRGKHIKKKSKQGNSTMETLLNITTNLTNDTMTALNASEAFNLSSPLKDIALPVATEPFIPVLVLLLSCMVILH